MAGKLLILLMSCIGLSYGQQYYGKLLGDLSQTQHEVKGSVYAVDEKRILIKDFNYDGKGPDAFFWVGKKDTTTSETPNAEGRILPDENGSPEILGMYSSKTIVLTLNGYTLRDLRWISVWCRNFSANFGWLKITDQLTASLPAPLKIKTFSTLTHQTRSGDVTIMDVNTIKIENMYYDGNGPDAFFLVGKGSPASNGTKIPDENGSLDKVKAYNGKQIMLNLPSGLTFFDIDYLSLYCILYTENFGDVRFANLTRGTIPPDVEQFKAKKNCETLKEGVFNVAWELDGSSAIIELSGAIDASDYMAFGVSGKSDSSSMANGDVTVVWKKNNEAKATDFFMSAYSLCSGATGVCPDTAYGGGRNDVELLEYTMVNGVTKARYRKTLSTSDAAYDKAIQPANMTQIIWAIGGVNEQLQPTKHHTRITENKQIKFGREATHNCRPIVGKVRQNLTPWKSQKITAMDGRILTASLGPPGGDRGYKAITGKQSWGYAWYIDGLLIPEITVKRGTSITFNVQGGSDATTSSKYHPFYITNDPVGGYAGKSTNDKRDVKIYQVKSGGTMVDKVTGKFCEWVAQAGATPESYSTFEEYKAKLMEKCDSGTVGSFVWKVAADTPDTVYYQCYTHNNLGWKINVVDDYAASASHLSLNILLPIFLSFIAVLMTLKQ